VGICMCDGGLNLKQLSGFSFLNLYILVEIECRSCLVVEMETQT
jgi:hypothetical protein